ncbi:MAG: hypothetical protein EXS35_10600 [Pedosphaera sp.]|nr:hypothetical protein [Pedosphaera sp.]
MSEPGEQSSGGKLSADWFSSKRFALVLALLIFATYPQVLLGLKTFVVRDYGFFAYPLAHFQREAFWRGEIPLWNPYNNCGIPFLAQWNTMPLYPPALIYLLLPLNWSLSFFCLAHQWFAGLGMYFLARRCTQNNFAAAFAGVAFAFNGLTLNLLMWPSHIATFAWMPWVVLLVERAWREGGKMIFLAALAGAMQMLGGGPETILFTWLLLAALWVMDLAGAATGRSAEHRLGSWVNQSDRIEPRRCSALLRFPLVVLLVAALAAAQLLPFLDLAAHSQREPGFADTRWAMPAWGWANYLVPMVFGKIWNMGVFFQYDQAWTSSYYLGTGALLLALLAAWRSRERRVWLLAAAGLIALAFAFGDQTFVVRELRRLIPQLTMMTYPVKYVLLVTFVAPLLAAFALARVHKRSEASIATLGGVLLALIAVILLWAWRYPFPTDNVSATLVNGLTRAGFLIASAALLFAMTRATKAPWRCCAPLALLLVAWLDVLTHEPTQNPSVAPWIYAPGLARTKLALQPQPVLGESRVMAMPFADKKFMEFSMRSPQENFIVKRLGFFADCNVLDDVPKVGGFFSLLPRECGELHLMLARATNASFSGVLDFLGVSQITAPEKFIEWEARANFHPLITAGQKPVFLDDANALWSLVTPQFDGNKFVFLPPETRALVTVTNQTNARVTSSRFAAERVDFEVVAEAASLVVVAQTYYHRWRAFVDDQPVPLLRANYAFQAVEVPAGKHRVRLVYVERGFQIGAGISLVAFAVCAAGLAMGRRGRMRRD